MRMIRSLGPAMAAAAALAACVPRTPPPAPQPAPVPPPVPPPPPPPTPAPPAAWEDAPLSPGDWTYDGEPDNPERSAEFQHEQMSFVLRCERNQTIMISLSGPQPSTLTIRTTYGERRLPATPVHFNGVLTYLPATDPLFDQMAFSRGRFLVQAEGAPALILPTWPEPARVIEDCRGQ